MKLKIILDQKEIRFAAIGAAVIMIWFLFIRNLIAPTLQLIPPIIAMLIYNIGLLVGLLMLGKILSDSKKSKAKISVITFIVIIGINILTAPYLVSPQGMITTNVEYWYVAADAGIASFWQYFVPMDKVWLFTYIISPILLIFVVPVIGSNPKKIAKIFKG